MLRLLLRCLLVLGLLSLCARAKADTTPRRFALIVGANLGAGRDQPLRFAEADASRVAAVFRYMGGFAPSALVELYTPRVSDLLDAVDRLAADIKQARAEDAPVLVLFYFSGHSDGDTLHTRGEYLQFDLLRRRLRDSGARVRLLIVDACKSGALTRAKGASERPPIDVRALGDLSTQGEAFIASTTSDELARESSLLRGSFFTHHLVSGLSGPADRSGDGKITLAEAYDYAYARTVQEAVGEQHPSYSFSLTGHGEVVLTSLKDANASVHIEPGPERHFIVTANPAGNVVAEATVNRDEAIVLALPPGRYELRSGNTRRVRTIQLVLAAGADVTVTRAETEPAPIAARTAPKGEDDEHRLVEIPAADWMAPRSPHTRVSMLFGLSLGTGATYVGGGSTTEVAYHLSEAGPNMGRYVPAAVDGTGGIATAPLHLRLDLGLRIADRWEVLASLRGQVIVGANAETRRTESGAMPVGGTSAAKGAVAGLLRLRYRIPRGRIAPFVEVAVGGGLVRARLDLSNAGTADKPLVDLQTAEAYNAGLGNVDRQPVCPSGKSCGDSIALGYALLGGGGGLQVELVQRDQAGLALSMSTTLLGAFGNGNRGLVADFELGLLARAF